MVRTILYLSSLSLLSLLLLSACSLSEALAPALAPTLGSSTVTTYTVQPGDTLSQIAARYHVTVQQLVQLNSDRYPILSQDPTKLRAGSQLYIPSAAPTDAPGAASQSEFPNLDLALATQDIVNGVNAARAQQGLGSLQIDPTLTRIAQSRSEDMIARNYFSHYDPTTDQEELLLYIKAVNYSYHYAGENIAEVKNDASWVPPLLSVTARYNASSLSDEFVTGWLNSPEHRDNIMNAHYRRTGVAISYSPDGRRIVATQLFSD